MVNLQTCEPRRNSPNFRKCAVVAALLSAVIVGGIELAGGPAAPSGAPRGAPGKAALAPAR